MTPANERPMGEATAEGVSNASIVWISKVPVNILSKTLCYYTLYQTQNKTNWFEFLPAVPNGQKNSAIDWLASYSNLSPTW